MAGRVVRNRKEATTSNNEDKKRITTVIPFSTTHGNMDIMIEIFYNSKRKESNILAYASITINEVFVIRSIRLLVSKKNTYFISFPQVLNKNGEYSDIAFPITSDLRSAIEDAVVDLYEEHEAEQ